MLLDVSDRKLTLQRAALETLLDRLGFTFVGDHASEEDDEDQFPGGVGYCIPYPDADAPPERRTGWVPIAVYRPYGPALRWARFLLTGQTWLLMVDLGARLSLVHGTGSAPPLHVHVEFVYHNDRADEETLLRQCYHIGDEDDEDEDQAEWSRFVEEILLGECIERGLEWDANEAAEAEGPFEGPSDRLLGGGILDPYASAYTSS